MIYRTAPFSATLNDFYPDFKVTPLFDGEYLRKGTRYRHSFNGILISTYTRPTQQYHLEWPWATLSDREIVTPGVARYLRDSWALVLTAAVSLVNKVVAFRFSCVGCDYSFQVRIGLIPGRTKILTITLTPIVLALLKRRWLSLKLYISEGPFPSAPSDFCFKAQDTNTLTN